MRTILATLVLTGIVVSARAQEVFIPDLGLNAAIREALQKPSGPLNERDMLSLIVLDASRRNVRSIAGLEAARNLASLDLQINCLTNFSLPSELTALASLDLSVNPLTHLVIPGGMTNLGKLFIEATGLTNLSLPVDLSGLRTLDLANNQFTRFNLSNLTSLVVLDLGFNLFTNLSLPNGLTNLETLILSGNLFANFALPEAFTGLAELNLSQNQLASFALPAGMTNLVTLNLYFNQLTNLVLPADLYQLQTLLLGGNQFTSLTLPAGLTNLTGLIVTGNLLTELTLPPDMTQLVDFGFLGNPLTTVVLSEVQAANLAETVDEMEKQGVSVFTYPLVARLVRPRMFTGRFQFGITGPPGVYAVLGSSDLAVWNVVGTANNALGSISFNDVTVNLSPRKFYRAQRQSPPTNMVFIAPNAFTMGSPTNELHRQANEGPQTTVNLTRGFWIGKYEVTQAEYLSVTGTNPSQFPDDLSRPVSTVSWPDATNYCWLLTQQERAAGRISSDSHYRLPTEAEWECAARAGTTTRFSYGNDPDYAELPNYAWQAFEDGLTVHPIGQKLPNPWGLYDMAGNVFEWCQDWLGPLPGGFATDPQGPPSNPIGWKIMRGGAFDFGGSACRSASRMFFPNHPALTDWNLGFRVVLAPEP